MTGYLLRRIAAAVPLVFGVLTLTFFMVRLAPGDPASLYISGDISPAFAEQLRHSFGLDQPLHVQYVQWLFSTVRGDFGISFSKHAPVFDVIMDTLPRTLLLTSAALALNFIIGIGLGIAAAVRRGGFQDHALGILSLFLYSMPEFWLGLMLILGLSLQIPIFPASGMHSPLASYLPAFDYAMDVLQHMVLPVFVLGIASAAATGRYMRGSLLEVINQDYVRTARAKGVREAVVLTRHALRNALLPIITLFGLSLPFLLGGAVIVETVFGWPGMGKLAVDAIFTRDYPMIIACTFVAGCTVIAGNLISDVLYAIADPRIRY